jgi:hypothetical protein
VLADGDHGWERRNETCRGSASRRQSTGPRRRERCGNPGYYLTFVFTASNAARFGAVDSMAFADAGGEFKWPPDEPDNFPEWRDLQQLQRFRRTTVVTTYSVLGALSVADFPTTFGPHGDEVRTLP